MAPSRSIRAKLALIIAASLATAVFLSFGIGAYRELARFSDAKRAEMTATADVLAVAVADAVAQGDNTAAARALNAIGRIPSVRFAEIRDIEGRVLAQAGNAVFLIDGSASEAPSTWDALRGRSFAATAPVIRGGVTRGSLMLLVDTSDLATRFRQAILTAIGSALGATLIGVLVAARLQRKITRPIVDLTATMKAVRVTNDFGRRAERQSDDEVGQLVDSFNDMLGQIRIRDEALEAHRAGLERTVEERTQQLALARDAAEAANRAKSDFLATMSHEIRTPLNGMLVTAELLARGALPPGEQRYADIISRSGQTLLAIINDILDLSKIEAGKLTLENTVVDPAKLVSDVLGLFWERAASKGLDLAAIIAPNVPLAIEGDPVRLGQIVSNLVNNALKFTERGSVSVEIRISGMGALEIAVVDTGIGIAPDKVAQVFEAFGQAEASTARRFGGTGLGLSISQRLVEAMGGAISVTSTEGEGSRFAFTIPLRVVEPAPSRVRAGLRAVVLVEAPATRAAVSSGLEDAGCKVLPKDRAGGADVVVIEAASVARMRARVGDKPRLIVLGSLQDIAAGDASGQLVLTRPLSSRDVADAIAGERATTAASIAASTDTDPPALPSLHLLVADDSPVNQEVARAALAALGLTCDVADDGRAAVAAWRSATYDIILMDCNMPGMDGYAATRAIRVAEAEGGTTRTPIVALTADVMTGAGSWREAGMDAHLAKPFTLASLTRIITRLAPTQSRADTAGPVLAGPQEREEPGPEVRNVAAATGASLDEAVLDGLRAMAGGSEAIVKRVLASFAAHAPARFAALQDAFADGDLERIAAEAHAIKSPSRNVGAVRLGELCQVVEHAARAGDIVSAHAIGAIGVELDAVLAETRQRVPFQQAAAV